MTGEERLAKAKEWHEKYVSERNNLISEVRDKETLLVELQSELEEEETRVAAIIARLEEVKGNLGYKLLPSWIREKIEEIFGA